MKLYRTVTLMALIGLAGCNWDVTSKHPAASLSDAKLQRDFIGTWRSPESDTRDTKFIHVSAAHVDMGTGSRGLMRFLFVSQPKTDQQTAGHLELLGYFNTIDNQLYLNLLLNADYEADIHQGMPPDLTADSLADSVHMFIKVEQPSHDRVNLVFMSAKAAARLINAGVLSGTVSEKGPKVHALDPETDKSLPQETHPRVKIAERPRRDSAGEEPVFIDPAVRLDSSTETIAAAIRDPANADLFNEESLSLPFERLK